MPSVIQLVMLPFMPESPKYLIINQNKSSDGRRALERLRSESVSQEFDEICQIQQEQQFENIGVLDLFKNR